MHQLGSFAGGAYILTGGATLGNVNLRPALLANDDHVQAAMSIECIR